MKKYLWLLFFISSSAFAQCTVSSGASTATIQTAINSMAAGTCPGPSTHTLNFGAGNYSITSQINIPCPTAASIMQGPVQDTTVWPITPTAILTNNGITNNWGFNGSACSNGTTIQFLEWNGNQPSGGGGGFLHINLGMNNAVIQYNFIHGNMALQTTQQDADDFIVLDGGYSSTHTQNTTIQFNQFGKTGSGDCGGNATASTGKGVMSLMGSGGGPGTCTSGYRPPAGSGTCLYQGQPNDNSGGGSCGAFGLHTNTDNFKFINNSVQEQEQGGKCFQHNGGTTNSTNTLLQYNDFSGIHRIGYEAQCNDGLTTINSNDFHDPFQPNANSWSLSVPQGNTSTTSNIMIGNTPIQNDRNGNPASYAGYAHEFWGGLTSSNNLIQGLFGGGIAWGFCSSCTPWTISNNIIQLSLNSNYISCCDQGASNPPSQSGNVTSNTVTARTSVAPTISPGAGSQTFPLIVTLTDPGYTSGVGPQGNTGIWYTTDGSTPVPGTGTAKYAANGGTFTLPFAATVKAVGMWGALNQPTSYASGYGFVPSAVISTTYTGGGGGPTLSTITLASTGGITSFTSGQTNQLIATGHYSDGSTANISSSANFSSSTSGVGSVTSPGGFYTAGATAGTTNINASLGLISTTTPLVLTTTAAPPVVSSGYLGNTGSINTIALGAGTIQFTAYVTYVGGTPPDASLPDAYGNTATAWSISSGSCGTVNSTGLFTPTTVGNCNVTWTCSCGKGVAPWTMHVTAATLNSITLASTGGVTSVTVGSSVQLIATGHYSDGTTANLTSVITSWLSSDNTKATISSAGLVTGVAAGSPTFTATYTGVTSSPVFPLTITSSVVLQSIVINTVPANVNMMLLNWTIPFDAHCLYSNGDNFDCVNTDGHGNAVTWTSSNTLAATFTTYILKEISATHGNGFVTASAAGVTSPNYNLTYAPAGPLIFSLTGIKVTFSGSSIGIAYK